MKFWNALKSALRFSAYGGQGVQGGWITDWIRWQAGEPYDYAAAAGPLHRNGVVMSCAAWIMRAFPEPPLQVMREEVETGEENRVPRHALTLAFRKPNPFYSSNTLWQRVVFDRSLHGNAYLYKVRNESGDVTALYHVPECRIIPQWGVSGMDFITHYLFTVDARQETIPIQDLVHFRFGGSPENERLGLATLGAGVREVAALNEGGNYRNSILRKMGVPSHILQSKDPTKPINKDQAKELHALWQARVCGNERGGLLIPNWALEALKIGMSPAELDLGSMLNWDADMVCSLFGLSSMVVGISSGSEHRTYANYKEAREAATENCLVPAWSDMGQELTLQLLPDYSDDEAESVVWDAAKVRALQEDQTEVWTRVIDAYKAEIIDRYTALTLLGRKAETKDKDVYYQQAGGVSAPLGLDGGWQEPGQPTQLPANGNGQQPALPAKAYYATSTVGFRRGEAAKGWVTLGNGDRVFIGDDGGGGGGRAAPAKPQAVQRPNAPEPDAGRSFVAENATAIGAKLSTAEQETVENYTTYLFDPINRALRSGKEPSKGDKADIERLDSAIAKSKTDRPMDVYRGLNVPEIAKGVRDGSIVGKTLTDQGFMSTSHAEHVTRFFGGGEDRVLMRVHLPKGTPALPAAAASRTYGDKQGEIILPRGSQLRVTAAHKMSDGSLQLEAEYV